MKQLRLIPLVVIAALGLLTMKALELFVSGNAMFGSQTSGQARVAQLWGGDRRVDLLKNWDIASLTDRGVDPIQTANSDAAPAEGGGHGAPAKDATEQPALEPSTVPVKVSPNRPNEAPPLAGPGNATEARLMEALGQRRKEVEGRERELDVREGLLKATEGNIEKRIEDLKTIESQINSATKSKEDNKVKDLADLVKMYEAMKAKDAARVFDRLEPTLLVDIARQMNPKKLADVVAKMSADSAEKLTVGLANRKPEGPVTTQGTDLPKIDGHDS